MTESRETSPNSKRSIPLPSLQIDTSKNINIKINMEQVQEVSNSDLIDADPEPKGFFTPKPSNFSQFRNN